MSAQITLYQDAQLTMPLSDGTWITAVNLGTATIPSSGSSLQTPVCVFAKNNGTTTIANIYITPIVGGGENGTQFAADISIAPDITGVAGTFGALSTQTLVFSGDCYQSSAIPESNTSTDITNPSIAPTLSVGEASSNLPAGTYTVAYTFTNLDGETLISPTTSITLTAGQSISVSAISLITNATGINYYMSYIAGNSSSLFFSGSNSGGASIDLIGANGFFQFWVRQTVSSSNTAGVEQAKLELNATDLG